MPKVAKWQLQEAKNRLSEVVDEALRNGPQVITRHGAETAVVVSFDEWTRLSRRRGRLIDVLRRAPKIPGGLEVNRSKDTGRELKL
ncbi:MAG TPA: type II toxin-antitoxin system Phd/YefM family antitoxin [Kofleriaceae bacterium]|nr:type II toxin-antitoxin system Phd/YefM family antitoxin [Kofleriaceae bacterium]